MEVTERQHYKENWDSNDIQHAGTKTQKTISLNKQPKHNHNWNFGPGAVVR